MSILSKCTARVVGALAVFALTTSVASAATVLLINGISETPEPNTTESITTNLSNLHTAAGNTVVVSDDVPLDLSPYAQVWDIRFSDNLEITSAVSAQYLAYLNLGRSMFVMGENDFFMIRNESVLALISSAGGGLLDFVTPAFTQTVNAPFTGPNAVSSIPYLAPGGVTSSGAGAFITEDASGHGTGVAFGVGSLVNAPTGALTVIFDVNFMQEEANAESQALTKNLIQFLDEETGGGGGPAVIPLPAAGWLLIAGLGGLGVVARRRRKIVD
jgi:hypothetical protein